MDTNVSGRQLVAPSCGNTVSKGLNMNIATSISLCDLRVVTQHVKVSSAGTVALLEVATQETMVASPNGGFVVKEVKVPMVPSNSIFGNGEWVRIQFGKSWHTVKSVVLDMKNCELVQQFDNTGGTVRMKEFFAVRNIPAEVLAMARYGKMAMPNQVIKVASKRAADFVVNTLLTPGMQGINVWSPWASSWKLELDQVGYGVNAARTIWRRAVNVGRKMGIEISEHIENLVLNMPTLMNDANMFVLRQPAHSSDNLMPMRIVVTDSPLAAPQVTPELMKLMGGDEDGDGSDQFTAEETASLRSFINKVMANIACRRNCALLAVYGLDYRDGSTLVNYKGETVDVSLDSVTFDTPKLWNDFQGFKVKGVIGLLCTTIWQYAWAFCRLLTEDEIVQFAKDNMSREEAVMVLASDDVKHLHARSIAKLKKLVTQVTIASPKLKAERLARLGTELTYRVFRDMFEHVFDARKGGSLAYDPIVNLKALSSTGRFDWDGMEAEGIWTAPLRLVASRIWATAVTEDGREYFKYSLREVIAQYDPIYFHFVSDRGNGWKNGFSAVQNLLDNIITGGLTPMVQSLYLQGGFISKPVVAVPDTYLQSPELGDVYDLLSLAKMGRVFQTGPQNMGDVISFLKGVGVNVSFGRDDQGLFLQCGRARKFLPNFVIEANLSGFGDGIVTPYVGHIIKTDNTLRAAPPVLIHESVNPFASTGNTLQQKNFKSKFPGINPDKFVVLNIYGVIANIVLGAAQDSENEAQLAGKAAARIREYLNKCELIKNDVGQSVFGDMLTVELRKSGLSSEWYSLIEDYTALALYEAGFSLYAVSKNKPMAKFLAIDPALGVPRLVAAYDKFWMLRTARRYDREALSTARNLRHIANPIVSNITDNLGLDDAFTGYCQNVTVAFFNNEANVGGHDPIDFTPAGMDIVRSDDVTWVWMSKLEKDEYMEGLDDATRQKAYSHIYGVINSGRSVTRKEQVDDDIIISRYLVPVEFGEDDMEGKSFKGNAPGTKSQIKCMGVRLVASYTPIKSLNTLPTRLEAKGKSQVVELHGVVPADTIVAKKAWSLIVEAAASRLDNGFHLDTTSKEEVITRVIPAIREALVAEGKPADGKMYIYRVTEEGIFPLTGPDGKVLRAVVGTMPLYRTRFESGLGNTMSKFRKGGLEKLGHIERVLIGEVPTITKEQREEMALIAHDLSNALKEVPQTQYVEEEFIF